jgi:DNA polymerase III subunit epsilon
MIILPFDTETTGLPRKDFDLLHPAQPHLVSLSALQVDDETQRILQSVSLRVKPAGWEWDESSPAFQVHQITMEEADKGMHEKDVLDIFLSLWNYDANCIAHNWNFDKQIISIAVARYQPKLLPDWLDAVGTCTMQSSAPLVGAVTANGRKKQPNLKEAYLWATGEVLERHHSANADAVACLHIYMALMEQQQ